MDNLFNIIGTDGYTELLLNSGLDYDNQIYNVKMNPFSMIDADSYIQEFVSNTKALDEETYQERAENAIFQLEVLNVDKFIKVNDWKEITNPTFFAAGGQPTSDGLLSNEIFGTVKDDRAEIFAYIDLVEYFIDPSCYKILIKLNKNFDYLVKGLHNYSIDDNGELVIDDQNGGTGIKWLKKNFDKLKFPRNNSRLRDMRINYIMHNYKQGVLFMNKCIVIPPFYRDVNTTGKYTGVGQVNTLYVNLITMAASLRENNDYGLSMADTTCAQIENKLVTLYDWFCGNNNPGITNKGAGLSGKMGIIRRANMSYTSDYSSRLVLTAPELKVETTNDMMATLDKSAAPLAAVTACFYPFMIFNIRKFFESELLNATTYETYDRNGNQINLELVNPMLSFTDEVIKDQLKKFISSYDTRITPIRLPVASKTNEIYFMWFKGERWLDPKDAKEGVEPIVQRPLTWVDVIYIAAVESVKDKKMSFTRFPYDSYFNTIYTGIEVASTTETESLYVNGEYYRFYPKIRIKDILEPSGQKFIDTMQISNLYLKGMGADYDGDTGVMKGSFFKETNEELADFTNSKANFIDMGCENIRTSSAEAVQAMYNFTKVLSTDANKLTDPQF